VAAVAAGHACGHGHRWRCSVFGRQRYVNLLEIQNKKGNFRRLKGKGHVLGKVGVGAIGQVADRVIASLRTHHVALLAGWRSPLISGLLANNSSRKVVFSSNIANFVRIKGFAPLRTSGPNDSVLRVAHEKRRRGQETVIHKKRGENDEGTI
jgi:hypothetical protein